MTFIVVTCQNKSLVNLSTNYENPHEKNEFFIIYFSKVNYKKVRTNLLV